MKATTETSLSTSVAARVAGEDINTGDYVSVLSEVYEWPSFLWCCSGHTLPPDEPVRTRQVPRNAGQPFRVVAICLPFVYAEQPRGGVNIFDTRQQQLVRLDQEQGGSVWHLMNKKRKKKGSS